jgi:hypothetical protein
MTIMKKVLLAVLMVLGVPVVCGGLWLIGVGVVMSNYEPVYKCLFIGSGVFAALVGAFLCYAAWQINHEK